MAIKLKFLFCAFLLITTLGNRGNAQTNLIDIINGFANRFYTEINVGAQGKDMIMSALSVQIALSILSLGAQGETLNELNKALLLPNTDFAKSSFQTAISRFNSLQGITLNLANKIYINNDFTLNPQVQKDAADWFYSEIEGLNFKDASKAVATINAWVEQKTNSKIKDIVDEDKMTGLIMLIINAIYFKGKWHQQFDPAKTKKDFFYLGPDKKSMIDMMTQTIKCPYADFDKLNARAIELFYEGKNASMVIVLPNNIDGLNNLEKSLENINLKAELFDQISSEKVISLSLPKFKIERTMFLNSIVEKLGAKLIFGGGDLSSLLTTNGNLLVNFIIQKAFIEVNEEGAEAAAATIIGITRSLPVPFKADYPFLFYIKTYTGEILFSGKFAGSNLSEIISEPSTEAPPNVWEDIMKKYWKRRLPRFPLTKRCQKN